MPNEKEMAKLGVFGREGFQWWLDSLYALHRQGVQSEWLP
jgi:hypothetical protein